MGTMSCVFLLEHLHGLDRETALAEYLHHRPDLSEQLVSNRLQPSR